MMECPRCKQATMSIATLKFDREVFYACPTCAKAIREERQKPPRRKPQPGTVKREVRDGQGKVRFVEFW